MAELILAGRMDCQALRARSASSPAEALSPLLRLAGRSGSGGCGAGSVMRSSGDADSASARRGETSPERPQSPSDDPENDEEDEQNEGSYASERNGRGAAPVWLQGASVHLSPDGEYGLYCTKSRFVVMQVETTATTAEAQYRITGEGSGCDDESENITCAILLSIQRASPSSSVGATAAQRSALSRTCAVIGYSTGKIRIYTEDGRMLFAQLLHAGRVRRLRLRTCHPHLTDQQEDLSILYPDALVTIDGFSLFQCLRACISQADKAASPDQAINAPPLSFKKWGLSGQEDTSDFVSFCKPPQTAYDHLILLASGAPSLSVAAGFAQHHVNPSTLNYLAVGKSPYVAHYSPLDGGRQLSAVAIASTVATKITSAVYSLAKSWWTGGAAAPEQTPSSGTAAQESGAALEPAVPLPPVDAVVDPSRRGARLWADPYGELVAVADHFGRVVVFDVSNGTPIALRMWKGYRDAECAWIVADERDRDSGGRGGVGRSVLFLAIHAPRRHLLEVWPPRHGPRISAFNVGSGCQLAYPGCGILGAASSVPQSAPSTGLRRSPKCSGAFLVDPDGSVRSVSVPFHCALDAESGRKSKDTHTVAKIRLLVGEQRGGSGGVSALESDVVSLVSTLATGASLVEAFGIVLHSPLVAPETLSTVLSAAIDRATAIGAPASSELSVLLAKRRLVNLHAGLCQSLPAIRTRGVSPGLPRAELAAFGLADDRRTSAEDALGETLIRCSDVMNAAMDRWLASPVLMPVSRFVSSFEASLAAPLLGDGGTAVSLAPAGEPELELLSRFTFQCICSGFFHPSQALDTLISSGLPPDAILSLLARFALSAPLRLVACLPASEYMASMFSSLGAAADEAGASCSWRAPILHGLSHCPAASSALFVALAVLSATDDAHAARPEVDLLSRRLEDVLRLSNALDVQLDACPTVTHLVTSSHPSKLIAAYIAGRRVPASAMSLIVSAVLLASPTVANALDNAPTSVTSKGDAHASARVEALLRRLPFVTPDELFACIAEEALRRWSADPDAKEGNSWLKYGVEYASASFDFTKNGIHVPADGISGAGLAVSLWDEWFLPRLKALSALIEKVNKAPKERLLRKTVGLGPDQCVRMAVDAARIAALIVRAPRPSEADSAHASAPHSLSLASRRWSSDVRAQMLCDRALAASNSIRRLTDVQVDALRGFAGALRALCHSLGLILQVNVRGVKPTLLFGDAHRRLLFTPLSATVAAGLVGDPKDMDVKVAAGGSVVATRNQLVSSSLQTSPDGVDAQFAMQLADAFGLDLDPLRLLRVVRLFETGKDAAGHSLTIEVKDRPALGARLLSVASKRIARMLLTGNAAIDAGIAARLPSTTFEWLLQQRDAPPPPNSASEATVQSPTDGWEDADVSAVTLTAPQQASDPSTECNADTLSAAHSLVQRAAELLPRDHVTQQVADRLLQVLEAAGVST